MAENVLKFNKDGNFRIMQIADTQEIPMVSKDTVELIEKALERVKPDLVVFTGDQIKGYALSFRGKNFKSKVKSTMDILLKPLVHRGIPFAVTFGNHDAQSGMSAEEQWAYYKSYPLCLGEDAAEADGCGTFNLPVKSSKSDKTAFNIYVIDSHGDAKGGGYEPVHPSQIEWYRQKREQLKNENGAYVSSLVFQHIPCHEYYNVLRRTEKSQKGAVRAYRTHKNEYYLLSDETVKNGGLFEEPPSIPDINTGEFEAMCEKGDVLGIYAGHDHKNSFVGKYKGVDLGYTPGAGFNVYGPGDKRGVRVFNINENAPDEYTSYVMTFSELCQRKASKPVMDYIYAHQPTTVDMAVPIIIKGVLALCAVSAMIILPILFL